MQPREKIRAKVVKTVFFLFFAIYLFPFVWIIITSVKPTPLIMSSPPVFIFQPATEHYVRLHTQWKFFGKVVNSLIISSITVILCLVVSIPAAYFLSRYSFKGRNSTLILILSFRFLPVIAILLPLYLFFRFLRLIDTYVALIAVNLVPNIPFNIWLLRSFFSELPQELDEAAKIDGCGPLMLLLRVIVPIAKPVIAVTAIFTFLFSWNEFFIPLVLSRTRTPTVTLAFAAFEQNFRFDWGAMCAAAVICLLPLFLVVILLQKHIVKGMTLGAVKE